MKQGIVARIILAIVFAGLVISPLLIKRFAARHDESKTKLDLQTALARHGFYLQEVSHSGGRGFCSSSAHARSSSESHHAASRFDGRVRLDRGF